MNLDFQIEGVPHEIEAQPVPRSQTKPVIEKAKGEVFFEFFEDIMFTYMPFALVAVLSMINFGSYILCAFMFMFWIICVVLFSKLKIVNPKGFSFSELIHLFIVILFFINYLANDQSSI